LPELAVSRISFALLTFLLVSGVGGARAAELVMFGAGNCEWCEVWDREVGVVYVKTAEAKVAPLRRIDVFAARPADLTQIKGVRYTPTFVLVDRGREIGRIVGYPGEDFFWELLAGLIKKLPSNAERACAVGPQGGKTC
jgi:hypothetical protein